MGRVRHAAKNIAFGYIGNIASMILGFILRSVFIMKLNETLLGINGLYTGVLSILSLAELGIGTALNYSLYAPVAEKDTEKIKSYMQLYKKAYYSIAVVVAVIGICISPFLRYIIKNPGTYSVKELTIYYYIFLFNTVSTYFVSYKYSLVNAEQKNYIQTNITTLTKLVTVVLQIIALFLTENFMVYLLTAAGVELAQKIFVNQYLNHCYPYLKDKNVVKLAKEETDEVIHKTKALVFHKVGDVARLQTDSIIISSFVSVALVGVVDNYNYVINSVSGFVNIIFNSVISSFGNLIATENKEKQFAMFKVYRFFACWIYGFSAIGFWILLSPLVELWLGKGWLLSGAIVGCILFDYYFKGDRIVLSNYKTAAGVFEQDKYLALIQGAVNLVVSIVLVRKIGLIGVYIGTIVSGLIANITKPIIIYKTCFDRSAWSYFADSVKYLLTLVISAACIYGISRVVMPEVTFLGFAVMVVIITVVYNAIFLAVFGRCEEFWYLWKIVRRR